MRIIALANEASITLRELKSAAAKFGGIVEDESGGRYWTYQVVAPEGKWWKATDGPHIVVTSAYGPRSWLDDAIKDGIERINEGIYDAEDN